MRVRYTPRATGDLTDILGYLDERSPQGPRNVKRAIHKAITLIAGIHKSGVFPKLKRHVCFRSGGTHI